MRFLLFLYVIRKEEERVAGRKAGSIQFSGFSSAADGLE
jgi:hypothetical protein